MKKSKRMILIMTVAMLTVPTLLTGCNFLGGKREEAPIHTSSLNKSGSRIETPQSTKSTNTQAGQASSHKEPTDAPQGSEYDVLKGKVLCIDPGHQAKADYSPEQVAPNTGEFKDKMAFGTRGVVTKVPEYKLNLDVSLKLEEVLKKYGANVVMTRTTHDVDLGNIDRAKMANENNADLMIRVHADGASSSKAKGMSMLHPGDTYIQDEEMLQKSKRAGELVLEEKVKTTGATSRGMVERNDITGFNWCEVPVILIEMGFMTNPEEDRLLQTEEYQDKIVEGIVNGLVRYFSEG